MMLMQNETKRIYPKATKIKHETSQATEIKQHMPNVKQAQHETIRSNTNQKNTSQT